MRTGTPQGGSISPLLANIYLHYVFDLWAHALAEAAGQGDVIIVRYADDFVVGFEEKAEAERFLAELRERFAQFGLELHPDKTRLIEFGRFAATEPGAARSGQAGDLRLPRLHASLREDAEGLVPGTAPHDAKRLRAKLQEVKAELPRRWHDPVPRVGSGWPPWCEGTSTITACL